MSVLLIALPVAILLGGIAVVAFAWATHRGQFDDLETPAWRMLMDEPPIKNPDEHDSKESDNAASDKTALNRD